MNTHLSNVSIPYSFSFKSGGLDELRDDLLKLASLNKCKPTFDNLEPEEIIFQPDNKATVVIWKDGSKTVVKCHEDEFSKEFGFAMALAKKVYGRSEFLRLVENANVQRCDKKNSRKCNNTSRISEYESELGESPNKKKTVQEAVRKCFELADSIDDLYEMISNLEGSTK